jgi:hypothetical protein
LVKLWADVLGGREFGSSGDITVEFDDKEAANFVRGFSGEVSDDVGYRMAG